MPPPDASSAMAEDVDSSPPLTQLPLISESPSSSSPALAVRRRLVFKRPRQPEFEPPPARAEADEDPVGFSGDSSSEEEEDVGLLWARLEARRDDTRVLYYKVRYRMKLWARRQAEMPREERMADFDDKVYATITGPWRRYCPARRGALGTRDVEHARRGGLGTRDVVDWARETWSTRDWSIGKVDVILTDQLPAASVKEMQSRGLLSSRQGWTGGRGTWAPAPHAGQPLRAGYFIFGL